MSVAKLCALIERAYSGNQRPLNGAAAATARFAAECITLAV